MADFNGAPGDDSITGTESADNFFMQIGGGGADTVHALGGDDSIFFGETYGPGDVVDGGGGDDRVNIQGDYSAAVTVDFTDVERLQLSGGGFTYKLIIAADCFTVAGGFTVDATSLGVTDSVNVDLRAASAGQKAFVDDFAAAFAVKGGAADDTVGYLSSTNAAVGSFSGGAGDDMAVFQTSDIGAVKLSGGKGFDLLLMRGDGDYDFTASMLKQFEEILLQTSAPVGLIMADGNVARGHSLWIDGSQGAILTFDGAAETNGAYSVTGSASNDLITGGAGGDTLTGGAGDDHFIYTAVSQSSGHHKQFDLITDLETSDLIDLSAIDARTDKAGDQAFHLVDHFTGAAGELVLSYSAGKDLTNLAGDIDGDGQADISIHVSGDHADFTNFVL